MSKSLTTLIILVASLAVAAADWNQWRGPDRNGISHETVPLADSWAEEGPPLLWKSEAIPSDHYGGHGSCVVADGKVYLSLVWHRDVVTETRAIDHRVLSTLGYRGNNFSPEQRARMEEARLNRSARLRGAALDEWAESWVEENLDDDQKLKLGSWVTARLRQGRAALSFEDFDKLRPMSKTRFESHDEMLEWVDGQGFEETVREKIIAAVPNTRMSAEDTVICFDAETGETRWRFAEESEETSRSASSTPAVIDGKVYAALREQLYAIDAETGTLLWKTPLPAVGTASCPLVFDGKVILLADRLVAYGVESGERVWEQEAIRGIRSSPVIWETGGRAMVACNAKNGLALADVRTGEVVAQIETGGGDSTPVVSGDHLVIFCSTGEEGFFGYQWDEATAQPVRIWEKKWSSRRKLATPIIHEGHVYLAGGDKHLCVEIATGETRWEELKKSNISSPVLVDGKLFVLETNGGFLTMIEATPEAYRELGRTKIQSMSCPSPTVSNGRLYIRQKEVLACFDLRDPAPASAD